MGLKNFQLLVPTKNILYIQEYIQIEGKKDGKNISCKQ